MSKTLCNSRILDRFLENKPVKTYFRKPENLIFSQGQMPYLVFYPQLALSSAYYSKGTRWFQRGTYLSFTIGMWTIHFPILCKQQFFFIALLEILTLASWFFSCLMFHMNVWQRQIKDIKIARIKVRGRPASLQKQQISAESKVNENSRDSCDLLLLKSCDYFIRYD